MSVSLAPVYSARHPTTRSLRIVTLGPGPTAGVAGAAAMVVEELLSREQLAGTRACPAAAPGAGVGRAEGLTSRTGHAGKSKKSDRVSMEEAV